MDISCRSVFSQRVKKGTALLQFHFIEEEVMSESLSRTTGYYDTFVISCEKIIAEELVASRKKVVEKSFFIVTMS